LITDGLPEDQCIELLNFFDFSVCFIWFYAGFLTMDILKFGLWTGVWWQFLLHPTGFRQEYQVIIYLEFE
jgi:hypothetical protein